VGAGLWRGGGGARTARPVSRAAAAPGKGRTTAAGKGSNPRSEQTAGRLLREAEQGGRRLEERRRGARTARPASRPLSGRDGPPPQGRARTLGRSRRRAAVVRASCEREWGGDRGKRKAPELLQAHKRWHCG
jgi:hypothetical protein